MGKPTLRDQLRKDYRSAVTEHSERGLGHGRIERRTDPSLPGLEPGVPRSALRRALDARGALQEAGPAALNAGRVPADDPAAGTGHADSAAALAAAPLEDRELRA